MQTSKRWWITLAAVALFILAVVLRVAAAPHGNLDTDGYLRWYQLLARRGFGALAGGFAVYTPPYLYLLWAFTLLKGIIPPIAAIKLIPTLFDILSALAVYRVVRLRFRQGPLPWLASAGFLVLPTVVLNSAYWGQIDSLYASFLLWCLYWLLAERPLPAMLAFGASFAIKAQAVFLLPFLLVLALRHRLSWRYFLVPPLVYIASILPAVFAGRPLWDAMTIYFAQVKEFPQLAMHAANLYSVVPHRFASIAYYGGLAAAAVLLALWTLYYGFGRFEMDSHRAFLLTALLSLVLVPFLLPRMHDRYFYPADILSYVLIFFAPAYAVVAAGYQLISGLVYYIFLHSVTPEQNLLILRSAVLLNTIMVTGLVVHQFLFIKRVTTTRRRIESSGESA